jgi:hypothetical protein
MLRYAIYPIALLALLLAPAAFAADEISTDITADLGGTIASDEDVVEDTGSGAPAKIALGALPAAADVIGYSLAPGGDILFSLDVASSLTGGVDVTPRDVVRYDGSVYTIEFEGADHDIPAGAKIDAIGWIEGDLLLSFDVTVELGAITADDEDLVQLASTTPDDWVLYFDGSANGVPAGADLDGADLLDATGHLALSFDISGAAGGVNFDDEDILDFDPTGDTWTMRYDGSTRFASLAAADVDAVFAPEPARLALGCAALFALVRIRRRRVAALSFALVASALVSSAAHAVDGVVEINQACAAVGCLSGDDPGLPVTISTSGSFRLTSDLVVPDANTTGVFVADDATLDLNGFAIRGPITCSGEPVASCSATGAAAGISTGERARIIGGTVRGFGTGIATNQDARISDVIVSNNSGTGVSTSRGTSIHASTIVTNGSSGVTATSGGGFVEVSACTIRGNGQYGVNASGGLVIENRLQFNGLEGLRSATGGGDAGYALNVINGNNGVGADVAGGVTIGCNVIDGARVCPP